MVNIREIEFSANGDMGKNGKGFRVKFSRIVPRGVNPKPGIQEGFTRRGIGRETTYEGTSLPRREAESRARDKNNEMGFPINIIPGLRATVVGEKMG